jgi:hypothetical protein
MAMTGGCLCGNVRYRVNSDHTQVFLCHCRQCQKAQGSAFVATVPVPAADFELLTGADTLTAFRASVDKARYFCRVCGSPIYSQVDGKSVLRLRAGSLDIPANLKVDAHIHTVSRASWYQINEVDVQYPGFEPSRTEI